MKATKLEIPVRRSKGSQGNITVQWSLFQNDSSDSLDLIWPTSGKVSMTDGQWNDSFILNVDNDRKQAPESVIWVQLENPTGGALLASRDKTTAKILIASNLRANQSNQSKWILITVSVCVASLLVLSLAVFWGINRYRKRTTRWVRFDVAKTSLDYEQSLFPSLVRRARNEKTLASGKWPRENWGRDKRAGKRGTARSLRLLSTYIRS